MMNSISGSLKAGKVFIIQHFSPYELSRGPGGLECQNLGTPPVKQNFHVFYFSVQG